MRPEALSVSLKCDVRLVSAPVPVTNEHLRFELEHRLDAVADDERSSDREVFEEMPKPEFFPAYVHLRVDDSGNMWVQEYPMPSAIVATWSVFDSAPMLGLTARQNRAFSRP